MQDSRILSLGDIVKANFLSISLKPAEMNETLKKKLSTMKLAELRFPNHRLEELPALRSKSFIETADKPKRWSIPLEIPSPIQTFLCK